MKKFYIILCLLALGVAAFIYLNQFKMNVEIITIKEAKSADNKYSAVVYSVDGGATTSHNIYIRILEQGEKFEIKKEQGDVFGVKLFEPIIDLTWLKNTLLVKCENCVDANIFLKKDKYKDVKVEFSK